MSTAPAIARPSRRLRRTAGVGPARRRSKRRRRGLSFVELMIGMSITGVIMLALAGFTVSVAAGWRHSDDEARVRNTSSRTGQQMADVLSAMLAVVQVSAGGAAGEPAHLFYWQNDAHAADANDGKAQFGEMALLEYDPTEKAVYLYQAKPAAALTADEQLVAAQTTWDGAAAATVTYFKASGIAAARRAVVGGASVADGGVAVESAQLGYFAATGAKPLASFQLELKNATESSTSFGNVTLRSARKPTNQ